MQKGPTRKQLIQWMSEGGQDARPDGTVVTRACLRRRYIGSSKRGVMWCVWERSFVKDGQWVCLASRWIECVVMRHVTGYGWAYKDFTERGSPRVYSCPLGYLDLVPVADEVWRQCVRAHHASLTKRRKRQGNE